MYNDRVDEMLESINYSRDDASINSKNDWDKHHNRQISYVGNEIRAADEDINNCQTKDREEYYASDTPKDVTSTDKYNVNQENNESYIKHSSLRGKDSDKFIEGQITIMDNIKKLLNEWEPNFKAGEYSPGDGNIDSPKGNGVAKRLPTDHSDCCDELSDHGDPFDAEHNETAAMCDVDDNGVENKPQGVHDSKPAKADDGHQEKVGHDWPAKPTNSGASNTQVTGTRYNNGGQLNIKSEDKWSPAKIGQLLGEDINLQNLFDVYAQTVNVVCLEDFQQVCEANGCLTPINSDVLTSLMAKNNQYMFYIGEDSNGQYWAVKPIKETIVRSPEEELEGPDYDMDYPDAQYDEEYGPFGGDGCPECGAYCDNQPNCPECGCEIRADDEEYEPIINSIHRIDPNAPNTNVTWEEGLDTGGVAVVAGVGGGSSAKDSMPKVDDSEDCEEHGDALGKKLVNASDTTPIMKGTDKGMSGKSSGKISTSLKENCNWLYNQINLQLRDDLKQIRGVYSGKYQSAIAEGTNINLTPLRSSLTEAILDLEEVLQFNENTNVSFRVQLFDKDGKSFFQKNLGLPKIKARPHIVNEGRTFFRLRKHAEDFTKAILSEGKCCQVLQHTYGTVVKPS